MDEIDEDMPAAKGSKQDFAAHHIQAEEDHRARLQAEQAEQKLHVGSMLRSLPTLKSADLTDIHGEISRVIDRTYSNTEEIAPIILLYFAIGLAAGPALVAVWAHHNYGLWRIILLYTLAFFLSMPIGITASLVWQSR